MKELRKKEVIIVAGPSASGKSYIMRQLKTKKKNQFKSEIYRELNINPRKSKSCISIGALIIALKNSSNKPKHYRKLKKKKIIFIHFDLTGRHQKQKRLLLLLVAKNCKKIKILTVHTPFNTWRKRMQNRFNQNLTFNHKNEATKIFRISQYFYLIAELQYKLVYKRWAKLSTIIAPNKSMSINN
jgi:ABC-type phosphate/phosphonate transport system ATPase subunit